MGRPRLKIIDDAQEEAEKKASKKAVRKDSENSENQNIRESEKSENQISDTLASSDLSDTSGTPSPSEFSEKITPKKTTKPGKAKPRSKKYQEISMDLDRTKTYPLPEAVELVKKLSYSKFPGTLEAHVNTAQTGIRGLVSLPYVSGKKLRILAFGPKIPEGAAAGDDSTIDEINKGKVDFDLIVTTPEWMPKLTKVARILGPRGLMPNPKNGTITSGEDGLKKAVEGFQAGKTEYEHSSKQVYKTEAKAPVIHLALGKLNQPNEELIANIKTLLQTLGKTKVKKVSLSPTMGPSVKIDLSSI